MPITGKFEADFSSFISESAKAQTALAGVEGQATATATAANTIGVASSGATAGVAELTTATTALAGANDLATLSNEQLDAMIAGETVALQGATVATNEAAAASGAYGSVLFTTVEAEVAATEASAGLAASLTAGIAAASAFIAPILAVAAAFGVAYVAIKQYLQGQNEAAKAEAERAGKADLIARAEEISGRTLYSVAAAEKVLEEAQRHRLLLDPALAAQAYIDKLSAQEKKTIDLAAEEEARNKGLADLGLVVRGNIDVEGQMAEARRKEAEAAKQQAEFEQRVNQDTATRQTAIYKAIQKSFDDYMKDQEVQLKRANQNIIDNLKELEKWQQTLASVERGQIAPASVLSKLGTVDVDTIGKLKERFKDAEEARRAFDKGVNELASSFSRLASVSGTAFGGILQDFAQISQAAVIADKAIHTIGDSTASIFDKLSSATNLISAGIETAKAIYNIFKGIGGPSKDELAGRDIAKNLESQFGSTADFIEKVGQAYRDVGKSSEDAQKEIQALWDAEKKGAQATQEAVDKLNEALKRSNEIQSDLGSLGIKSHDELIHAADIANATYQKIFDGVKTGQYTAEDATKAYLAYQQALADAGDTAAQAWLKSQQAASAGVTAVDSATAKLISQRDALNTSISAEAPEAQIGVIEQQQRAQRDAFDKQIKDAQTAADAATTAAQQSADATTTANSDASKEVEKYWGDTAVVLKDDLSQAGNDAANNIKDSFGFTIHIPVVFDTPTLPVIPMASGGSGIVTKPTLFLAGEAGPESFNFGGAGRTGGAGVTVNGLTVNVQVAQGDNPKVVADTVLEALRTQAHLYAGIAVIADRQIAAV